MLAGCGGSSSDAPSAAQLEAAKHEGEEAAHERDRVNSLQKQIRSLKHQVKHRGSVVVEHASSAESAELEANGSTVLRTFHAPSGNVSCEILSHGALCSVGSIDETFSFSDGQPAQVTSGAALADGTGELAPYGSTVSAGSISCTVPNSSEPHGIVCEDNESGHGFEASRVSVRQRTY
jgi:hypothetical protein